MTLAISTLKTIFPLHTETHVYHLKYPMCYPKCHNVDTLHLKEVNSVDQWNHIGN